jgi:hypothetical protein
MRKRCDTDTALPEPSRAHSNIGATVGAHCLQCSASFASVADSTATDSTHRNGLERAFHPRAGRRYIGNAWTPLSA